MKYINIKGIRQNNLRNIDVSIPRGAITVLTGVSGSGKSTLAFDTIFAEGQRKYLESLSNYARQFIDKFEKPDLDFISGLSPTISVDQKTFMRNPRSTVSTITEIYDFLRLLFARVGEIRCYQCDCLIDSTSLDSIVAIVSQDYQGDNLEIYFPIAIGKKGEFKKEIADAAKLFSKVKIDGKMFSLNDIEHEILRKMNDPICIARVSLLYPITDSIKTSLNFGNGIVVIEAKGTRKIFNRNMACSNCGNTFPEISPRFFSFNSPYGQCEECEGLGYFEMFDPKLVIPDSSKSIKEGAVAPFKRSAFYKKILKEFILRNNISETKPFAELSLASQQLIIEGNSEEFEGVVAILEKWFDDLQLEKNGSLQ